jgi:hypothetical protein
MFLAHSVILSDKSPKVGTYGQSSPVSHLNDYNDILIPIAWNVFLHSPNDVNSVNMFNS